MQAGTSNGKFTRSWNVFPVLIRDLFNLQGDTDEAVTVESIRKNAEFRSGNAWTLVFAIFIASIGLNTNSVAVIIGAMLISPMMGPIVGAGLALGINDFELLKKSIRSLLIGVVISIVTSSLYFLLSPLSDAQSELLARTRPTFFDVMIGLFGGAAGIVAASRKERGNAIPGVAIATALMPPLCTAGYGLATGEARFFFGALYLFIINSVYICLSTYFFTRLMRFHAPVFVDAARERRIRRLVTTIAIATFLPSVGLAWIFVREEVLKSKSASFVKVEFARAGTYVVNHELEVFLRNARLHVDIMGSRVSDETKRELEAKLGSYGLADVELDLRYSTFEEELEKRLQTSLLREEKNRQLEAKQTEVLAAELKRIQDQATLTDQISKELAYSSPEVETLRLAYIYEYPPSRESGSETSASEPPTARHVALIKWKRERGPKSREVFRQFLRTRLDSPDLTLIEMK